jgi:hypothetical protein
MKLRNDSYGSYGVWRIEDILRAAVLLGVRGKTFGSF